MGSAATGRPGSGRGQGGGRAFAEPSGEPHAAQVAILRAQGRPAEASRRLCEHLQVVCSDADAWLELHALYLARQQARRDRIALRDKNLNETMNGTMTTLDRDTGILVTVPFEQPPSGLW